MTREIPSATIPAVALTPSKDRDHRSPFGYSTFAIVLALGVGTIMYWQLSPMVQNVAYNSIAVCAAAACLIGVARNRPRPRFAWFLLALGMLAYSGGDILYGVSQPMPSPADMLYVSAYPLFGLAMVAFARTTFPGKGSRSLDNVIVIPAIALFVMAFLFIPSAADAGFAWAGVVIALGYPVLDVGLLSVAVRLRRNGGAQQTPFSLLMAGWTLFLAADIGYSLLDFGEAYAVGSYLDPLWLLAYLCMASATLSHSHETSPRLKTPALRGVSSGGSELDTAVAEVERWQRSRAVVANVAVRQTRTGVRFQTVLRSLGMVLLVLAAASVLLAMSWQMGNLVLMGGAYGGTGAVSLIASRIGA